MFTALIVGPISFIGLAILFAMGNDWFSRVRKDQEWFCGVALYNPEKEQYVAPLDRQMAKIDPGTMWNLISTEFTWSDEPHVFGYDEFEQRSQQGTGNRGFISLAKFPGNVLVKCTKTVHEDTSFRGDGEQELELDIDWANCLPYGQFEMKDEYRDWLRYGLY